VRHEHPSGQPARPMCRHQCRSLRRSRRCGSSRCQGGHTLHLPGSRAAAGCRKSDRWSPEQNRASGTSASSGYTCRIRGSPRCRLDYPHHLTSDGTQLYEPIREPVKMSRASGPRRVEYFKPPLLASIVCSKAHACEP
jgi:hypothetical protein